MGTIATLDIEVFKGPTRRYRSVLRRADGVEIELDGGAYNAIGGEAREVPHDIAHLIVEDELGVELGVWGVLAAGGLFRGATVLSGRRPPHAERRAREVLEGAVEQLNQAEILTRAVCDLSRRGTADLRALRSATGETLVAADGDRGRARAGVRPAPRGRRGLGGTRRRRIAAVRLVAAARGGQAATAAGALSPRAGR